MANAAIVNTDEDLSKDGMYWELTPYVIPLLISAAICTALAMYAWPRRLVPGQVPFVLLMLAAAEWSLAYAVELSCGALAAKVFWAKVQYFGAVIVPVAWLLTVLQYTGRPRRLERQSLGVLAVIPAITLLQVWTNDIHGMMWYGARLDTSGPFAMLKLSHGPWFWVNLVFSYLLLVASTVLLIRWLLRSPALYRQQATVLILGVLGPWVGNVLYVSGLSPFTLLDLTPFGFAVAGLGVAWGLFRFRLLDIVPVARHAIIEGMGYGVIVLDVQSRVVDINPAARQIIGAEASQVIGQPVDQILADEAGLIKAYRDVTDARAEIVLGEGEGQRLYALRISPLHDRRGRLNGRLFTLRDLTERNEARILRDDMLKALRQSEARYRSLFDGVPLGLYRTTPDGRILDANLALTRMLGYPDRESLLACTASLLYANPEDRQHWKSIVAREGVVRGFEVQLRRRDGTTIWVADNSQAVRDVDGSVLYYEGSLENISERVEAEEALRSRNRELTTLYEAATTISSNLSLDAVLTAVAEHMARALGASSCAISIWDRERDLVETLAEFSAVWPELTEPPGTVYHLNKYPATRQVLERCQPMVIQHDDPLVDQAELSLLQQNEAYTLLMLPLVSRDRVLGLAELIHDVEERYYTPEDMRLAKSLGAQAAIAIENARLVEELRQHAQELEDRNEELDAFAHTVAHDLKSPLAKVVGYCELLQDGYATFSTEELGRYLHTVAQHGRKLSNVIDEFLLLAGVRKNGKVALHPLDMARIVAEAQDRLAFLVEERQAEIIVQESWPVALGYSPWVVEVWTNYISNAVKYGGQPPRVELGATTEENGVVRFWVRDNGPGLTPADQSLLFTPFTRLDRVRAEGHGLGLSIVRRILEKLGGEVDVESEAGGGSVFSFTLRSA